MQFPNSLSANELALSLRLKRLTEQDGWADLERIFKEKIESLDTVKGLTTVKDLQARKECISMLENFWNNLQLLANASQIISSKKPPETTDIYKLNSN